MPSSVRNRLAAGATLILVHAVAFDTSRLSTALLALLDARPGEFLGQLPSSGLSHGGSSSETQAASKAERLHEPNEIRGGLEIPYASYSTQ